MPDYKKGESRNDYVSRAIPIILAEAKKAGKKVSQKAAVGKAEGMYTNKWTSKKKRKNAKR